MTSTVEVRYGEINEAAPANMEEAMRLIRHLQNRPSISAERLHGIWVANSGPLTVWRGRWMDEAGFKKALGEAGVEVKDE